MHASRVRVHSWNGSQRQDDVVEQPNVATVEAAVRRMDGERVPEVCIEAEDGSYLILGGGLGRYVGFVSRGEEEMHDLISTAGSTERWVTLRASGQTGRFTERQVVDLPTALRAACTFAERGELEPSVAWEIHRDAASI